MVLVLFEQIGTRDMLLNYKWCLIELTKSIFSCKLNHSKSINYKSFV